MKNLNIFFKFPHRFFIIVLVFIWGLFGCGARSVPQKAPDFKVRDIQGKSISLMDLRGKVVLLDFWATWCPPCIISTPEIEKLAEEYNNKPFEVLSLSMDEDPASVTAFIAKFKVKNRVALVGETEIPSLYNVSGIPAFYLIDQKGDIVGAWGGYSPMMPTLWRKELDRLLKA